MSFEFNPIKEATDGKIAKRIVWTTKTLEKAIQGIVTGKKLVANPFYDKEIKLLKADLVFQRTEEEIAEWRHCASDILYFAEKYCKLMTPEGIQNIKLRDYQKKYLHHLQENRLSIYLACRQCGKTTTSAIFILWYILFNVDKNTLVLGNKKKTAVEILTKAKKIYLEIPHFLKPGIHKWNESEIVLDNGCMCMAEATTINSGISFTFHCVLSDEFAHIKPSILDEFYNNLFPVITAGHARFIITSTQKGYNLFYRLYKAAEAGINEYKPFKTDWYEVPEWNEKTCCWEERTEEWRDKQVANLGGAEAFNKQFGTDFDVSSNTLIDQKIIRKKRKQLIEFVSKELPGVPDAEHFYWHPDYDVNKLRDDYLIITGDLAEGKEQDNTVFSIFKLIHPNTDDFECVGMYKTNNKNRKEVTLSIQTFCALKLNINKYLLSYEFNTYGELFYNQLCNNMDKRPDIAAVFDTSILVKYYNDTGTKFNYGIKLTRGNKSNHCLLFKESYEQDAIIDDSTQFMIEMNNFCDDGTGHYKASFGHDDIVMTHVQLEFVKKTLQYKILRDTFDDLNGVSIADPNVFNPYGDMNIPMPMQDMYKMIDQQFNCKFEMENRLNRFS